MTHNTMCLIAETFPTTKWAVHTSKNYVAAYEALKGFEDEEVLRAVRKLRTLIARNHLSVEELLIEIGRMNRQQQVYRKPEEDLKQRSMQDKEEMVRYLGRCQIEDIRKAVTMCRTSRVLGPEPLSPKIEEWKGFAVGVVYAALQRMQGSDSEPTGSP